jgi:hypothetical protein
MEYFYIWRMESKKILNTTNYRQFKFLKGNRVIVKSKINKLKKSYESGLNLFEYCPVLVNQDNYIIDGQHRFETCKELKLPVYYMVVKNITLLQIAQLNSAANKWSIGDFFNCFIESGNKDYKTLQFFKEKYNIGLGSAVALLMYGSVVDGGSGAEQFKSGNFSVKHQEKAEKIMKAVFDYQDIVADGVLNNKHFIRAIQILLQSNLYSHKTVVEKIKAVKLKVENKKSYKDFIYQIEALYNTKNSKRQIIYQSAK